MMKKTSENRFSRNIGIFTEKSQNLIKSTSIAIGGLGLGGSIFMNLVRLGFENFHVADPDTYEIGNINRQRLATDRTIGRRKDDCLIEEARAINPSVRIRAFREGVTPDNVGDFLEGIDWAIDVIDVFAMSEKLALNREARRRKVPLVSCAAAGFTAALVVFDHSPGSPSFEDLSGISPEKAFLENCLNFVNFIVPEIPSYMTAQIRLALVGEGHLPFVAPGVEAAAASAAAEIAKSVTNIGRRVVAPKGIAFDLAELKTEIFIADYRKNAFPMSSEKNNPTLSSEKKQKAA